jgi:hypothetical protein
VQHHARLVALLVHAGHDPGDVGAQVARVRRARCEVRASAGVPCTRSMQKMRQSSRAGSQAEGDAKDLPWGVALAAPAFKDMPLLRLADLFHRSHRAQPLSFGATTEKLTDTPAINNTELPKGSHTAGTVKVAVCGARLLGAVQSAPEYNYYALAGGPV